MREFRSLYVHIPFCERKCPYCDFNSHAGQDEMIPAYLDALEREIRETPWDGGSLSTLFVGGGTPTTVPADGLVRVLRAADERFGLQSGCEITIEANPGSSDAEKFAALRKAGVNRLSIGVQSWENRLLAFLGRVHDADEAERAYRAARAAGFDNVNLDLIHSLPGQTVEGWADALRRTAALSPEHVSAYCLTIESDTAFGASYRRGALTPLPDETQRAMLRTTEEVLASAGCAQYETSNFARPSRVCRHNLTYWRREPYLGVGAGAHSFLTDTDGVELRSWNMRPPAAYIAAIEAKGSASAGGERIGLTEALDETILLSLRTTEGIDLERMALRFGEAARDEIERAAEGAEMASLVGFSEDRLRLALSTEGRLLADAVILELSRRMPDLSAMVAA